MVNKNPFRRLSVARRAITTAQVVLLAAALLAPAFCHAAGEQYFQKQYGLCKIFYANLQHPSGIGIAERSRWLHGIESFQSLARQAPDEEATAGCLYLAARMYEDLFADSRDPADLSEALALYDQLARLYPQDRLADDSLFRAGELYLFQKQDQLHAGRIFAKITALYPDSDMAAPAIANLEKMKSQSRQTGSVQPMEEKSPARIMDLRFGSTSYYTRIVVETSDRISYSSNVLPAAENQPRRLYFDLDNAVLPHSLQQQIPVNDGLLQRIRSGQHSEKVVRIVLDTESYSDYQVSTQEDPFRIIIDVWGKGKKQLQQQATGERKESRPSLPRQLGLGAHRIVIDPGHGGKDPGAIGAGGLMEKDIVLAVALDLRDVLKEKYGFEVLLTREKDEFLSLEERTELANTLQGDIFVSLHANSAPSSAANGIETYFLSLASTGEEMQAAAKENASSDSRLSDLQAILQDLMQNAKINESAKLAESVQEAMVSGLSTRFRRVNNLGVKKAPFIVLIGAQMPSILTEIAFLSNPREASRLRDSVYQKAVAYQIAAGIEHYVDNLQQAPSAASL